MILSVAPGAREDGQRAFDAYWMSYWTQDSTEQGAPDLAAMWRMAPERHKEAWRAAAAALKES